MFPPSTIAEAIVSDLWTAILNIENGSILPAIKPPVSLIALTFTLNPEVTGAVRALTLIGSGSGTIPLACPKSRFWNAVGWPRKLSGLAGNRADTGPGGI